MNGHSILIVIMVAAASIPVSRASAGEAASQDFGGRLQYRPYTGAGAFIPKESDIGVAAAMTFGFEIADENDACFIDMTFAQSGKDASILWASGDVRNTVLFAGCKTNFGKWTKWRLGAGLQSHRMDFGSRQMTAASVAAVLEYKLSNKTALQFISSQVARKSDVRFGGFQISLMRYF